MDEAHMSQKELSNKSGIAHETISKILNEKYYIPIYKQESLISEYGSIFLYQS